MSNPSRKENLIRERIQQLTEDIPVSTSKPNQAIIIGGQPGAGKSSTQNSISSKLPREFVHYDGDDNAKINPNHSRISLRNPQHGHRIASDQLPEDLHQRCMDHLRAGPQKYDVIASHPLGRKEWADAWVDGFKEHGYHVSVAYVTTHEANSLLGVVDRYQRDRDSQGYGRWLDPHHHDDFYDAIPDVAHHLESEGRVDSLFVVNRDGAVLYANHRDPETGEMRSPLGAREAILAERNRPPTPEESADFERKVAHLRDDRLRRNGKPEELNEIVDQAEHRHRQRPAPSPDHGAERQAIGDALRNEEGRKEAGARSEHAASLETPTRRRIDSESENSGSSSGGERLAPSSTGNGSGPRPAPDAPPHSGAAPARPVPASSLSEAATGNHVDARPGRQADTPSDPSKPEHARAGDGHPGGPVSEEDPRQRIARSSERLHADRTEHRESAVRTRTAADQRFRHDRAEEERRRGTERRGPSVRDEPDQGPEI